MSAYVVQDVQTTPRAESYTFHSVSAFSIFFWIWDFFGLPVPIKDDLVKDIPSNKGCFTPEFMELMHVEVKHTHFNSGNLYNACRSIEGKYIDLLKEHDLTRNPNHWAIGPFNPVLINQTENEKSRHSCLHWLDEQAVNSVIFVSFGTTTSFKDEQIIEIALGLEQSDQKFIWVLRDADKGDVFDENVRRAKLPKGYEERIEGQGIVVRDWAPQLEILSHPATGGFLSHCGWNSCMESISCGVPIATWPMHSDQPRNAIFVTRVLKVGVTVRDWADRDKLVTASVVENGVRKLMENSEGVEMRKRAAELGAAAKTAVAKGGISQMELDSFVAHITR
jgi:cis-zeatin O-glucosyltransferase